MHQLLSACQEKQAAGSSNGLWPLLIFSALLAASSCYSITMFLSHRCSLLFNERLHSLATFPSVDMFIYLHPFIATHGTPRCAIASLSPIALTCTQQPAAAEGPALLEDDSIDEGEAGDEEDAAQIPAPKHPRKLMHQAKQGCFCCGITRAKKFYHCHGVSFGAALKGAGADDIICMDCNNRWRKPMLPTMAHNVRCRYYLHGVARSK